MRLYSGRAAALVVAVVAAGLPATGPPAAHAARPPHSARAPHAFPAAASAGAPAGAAGPAPTCLVGRHAGTAVATCHNPGARTAEVQLHIACARWWDPAVDTRPVTVGPAQWVTLTGHCWKEIREAWTTRRT
jgi:hypothetical protein